jgi:hypothetical protein
LKKLLHITGTVLITIAVNLMIIGVIVEFHQVHVFKHNVQFWQLMATKTANKDSKKYIKSDTGFVKTLDIGDPGCESQQFFRAHYSQLRESNIYFPHVHILKAAEYRYSRVLRGPPFA